MMTQSALNHTLRWRCRKGSPEQIRELLEQGASIDLYDRPTCLELAISSHNVALFPVLVNRIRGRYHYAWFQTEINKCIQIERADLLHALIKEIGIGYISHDTHFLEYAIKHHNEELVLLMVETNMNIPLKILNYAIEENCGKNIIKCIAQNVNVKSYNYTSIKTALILLEHNKFETSEVLMSSFEGSYTMMHRLNNEMNQYSLRKCTKSILESDALSPDYRYRILRIMLDTNVLIRVTFLLEHSKKIALILYERFGMFYLLQEYYTKDILLYILQYLL
jgi:hypothetical protein